MAVNDIHRIVDVERHRRGGSGVAGAVEIDHHALCYFRRPISVSVVNKAG
jgi:hypothetical protein